MKIFGIISHKKTVFQATLLLLTASAIAQNTSSSGSKSDFWEHVQFGGAFALNIGSGYTEITLAPGAIYNFNPYFALGTGIQGTYISSKNNFNSTIFGANLIALFNPMPQIQLSAELEELHVTNKDFVSPAVTIRDDFWNTALFLGMGYRTNNVTVGFRYNILFDPDKNVYADGFMPFVRAYF